MVADGGSPMEVADVNFPLGTKPNAEGTGNWTFGVVTSAYGNTYVELLAKRPRSVGRLYMCTMYG